MPAAIKTPFGEAVKERAWVGEGWCRNSCPNFVKFAILIWINPPFYSWHLIKEE